MMDSKKALEEADGDFDKAVEILRVKGAAKAAKRGAERTASAGLVANSGPALVELRCETDHGQLVDPYTVLKTSLEGHVRFVILNETGIPIRWGRKRRLFQGAVRDAVRTLGYRCIHPGCRVRGRRCQIDHTIEWHTGGETDPTNGGPGCGRHNRLKHHQRYTVHRDPHGHWHTHRPDGTEIR